MALALPAFTVGVGVMPAWLGEIDPWLMWISLAFAMGALALGVYRHGHPGPLGAGMVGALVWGLANLGQDHAPLMAASAGILFIFAHAWNLKCHRRLQCECETLSARNAGR